MDTSSLSFYVFCIIALIIGVAVVKKVASCLIKTVVLVVLLGIAAYLYNTVM